MRPLCQCGFRPAAVNYKKGKKTYYRRQCEVCLHHGKLKYGIPRWRQAGYNKEQRCEKCGFKAIDTFKALLVSVMFTDEYKHQFAPN